MSRVRADTLLFHCCSFLIEPTAVKGRMESGGVGSRLTSVVLIVAILAGGCTKTYVHQVANYSIGAPAPVEQPVPRTGVYTVRWTDGRQFHDIEDTARVLRKGRIVGFAPTTNRSPVAIAGDERIELGEMLPPAAVRCLWYHRSTEPTRFTSNVFKGGKATAEATVLVVVVGVVLAGAVAYAIWASSIDDD
jgi:hypothetical protein